MNSLTKKNNKLVESLSERNVLISHSIYGAYLNSTIKNPVTFYQVLNRCILLIQYRICIAIYKKTENGYEYCKVDFINDEEHIGSYLNSIQSLNADSGYLDNKFEKSLFNIYSTGFYFLTFTISVPNKKRSNAPSFDLLIRSKCKSNGVDIESYINNCFTLIFKDKTAINKGIKKGYEDFDLKTSDDFNTISRRALNELVGINKKNKEDKQDKTKSFSTLSPLSSIIEDFQFIESDITQKLEQRYGIFDKLYTKVTPSLKHLLTEIGTNNSSHSIPNILYFKRSFNRNSKRYKVTNGYNYNVNQIIPISQERDFIKYISNQLIRIKKGKGEKEYCFNKIEEAETRKLIKSIEVVFWDIVIQKNKETKSGNKGYKWIVNLLRESLSDDIQSLCDSVMISGLIHYRTSYLNGSFNRLLSEKKYSEYKGIPKKEREKYFSIIASSLMLSAVSPDNKSNNPQKQIVLGLYPIEISGRITSVIATVLYLDKKIQSYKSYNDWNKQYYFYHYIILRSERLLRTTSKLLYIDESCNVLHQTIYEKIIKNVDSDEVTVFNDCKSSINTKIAEYCRYVPFDVIYFNFISLDDNHTLQPNDGNIYILNMFLLEIELLPNPFFLNKTNIGKNVLNSNHIETHLRPVIKQLELEIYDYLSMASNQNTEKLLDVR